MLVPTIHLNGTARSELHANYCRAYEALSDAMHELGKTAPHGRDYYPQSPTAINHAIEEHRARCDALQSVKAQILELCLATSL
jgi:hypothetical protein